MTPRDRARQRLARSTAATAARQFCDAEERAAAAQHPARPAAERDLPGADRRVVHGAEGLDLRRHRPQRLRQEHGAEAGRRHHQADERHASRVDGRISALIELGAGFHPEISGRENVFINGIMLGLTKREIQQRFDEIVDFAELREFIDAPVKTYSSGMYMRLGFAVAIHVDPDVLLVDEVLAVGDEGFTHKCLDKFAEFKRRNKTILLVTHSLGLVERFCDEALWLDDGQRAWRTAIRKRVVGAYLTEVEEGEETAAGADDREGGRAARRRAPDEPQAPPEPDDAAADDGRASRHVPGDRRPLGLARGRDHRRRACSTATGSRRSSSTPATRWRSACKLRAHAAGRRLRLRHRPVQRRRRLLLRHQHQPRGDERRSGSTGDGRGDVRDREPRSRRRHLQARRRRPQARRLSRTTTTGCSTRSA